MLLDIIPYLVVSTFTVMGLSLVIILIHRGGLMGVLASVIVPGFLTWDAWHKRSFFLSMDTQFRADPTLLRVAEVLLPIFAAATFAIFFVGSWQLIKSHQGPKSIEP